MLPWQSFLFRRALRAGPSTLALSVVPCKVISSSEATVTEDIANLGESWNLLVLAGGHSDVCERHPPSFIDDEAPALPHACLSSLGTDKRGLLNSNTSALQQASAEGDRC